MSAPTVSVKKQNEAEDILQFTRDLQSCDIRNSWLKTSDQHFLQGAIDRQVRAARNEQESVTAERRNRLRSLLEKDEQQLLQEMEAKKETMAERRVWMRERAQTLRDQREAERQQLVSDKLEQLFRAQSDELRGLQSRLLAQQISAERAAQVMTQQDELQEHEQLEKSFHQLWLADSQAKEDREVERIQTQQQRNKEQQDFLKQQLEEAEQQKRQHELLRQQEGEVQRQLHEAHLRQQQQEKQQHRAAQRNLRRQLDHSLGLKMERVAREQQEELRADMRLVKQAQKEETGLKQEADRRKVELWTEQQQYRQYLSDELRRQQREEDEKNQLMEEKLKETWEKHEKQKQLQRDMRRRLRDEVMEVRCLQVAHKKNLETQKQAEVAKDREDMDAMVQEMREWEEEARQRQQQERAAYQMELQQQLQQQQQRQSEERAQAEANDQQRLILRQQHQKKIEEILARPRSTSTMTHPARREEGPRAASAHIREQTNTPDL